MSYCGTRCDSAPSRDVRRRLSLRRSLFVVSLLTALVAAAWPSVAAAQRAPLIVSLTFDDGTVTQFAHRSQLESRGMRGTYYIPSGAPKDGDYHMAWSQISTLAAAGHEIGGHTLDQRDLTAMSDAERKWQICKDRRNLIERLPGVPITSFAYPGARENPDVQAVVQFCGYSSGRVVGGIPASTGAEFKPPSNDWRIRTPCCDPTDANLRAWVNDAYTKGGDWVVLVFHEISAAPGATSVTDFQNFLTWLRDQVVLGRVVVQKVNEVVAAKTPGTQLPPDVPAPPAPTPPPPGGGTPPPPGTTPPPPPRVDTVAPNTRLTRGPAGTTRSRRATFRFAATEAGSRFVCRLDRGRWTPCRSPKTYRGLRRGSHTFYVAAIDAAGNRDTTPARKRWRIR